MTSRALIEEFFGLRRIAFIGVSRDSKDFTRALFREFLRRDYDAVPVNPGALEIEGKRCFPRVQDVTPGVDGALITTPRSVTEQAIRDCAEAGIRMIWIYRGTGKGAVSQRAIDVCNAHGIAVVAGECPYMFFENSGFPHKLHSVLRRLTGSYPR